MMKNRWIFIGLLISLAFNFSFMGALGYRLWERKERQKINAARIKRKKLLPNEKVKIRPEQKAYLEQLRKTFKPRIRGIKENLNHERRMLGMLLMDDLLDTNQVNKHIERIGNLQIAIEKAVVYQLINEKEMLDPDQRRHFIRGVLKKFQGDHSMFLPQRKMKIENQKFKKMKEEKNEN
jgi:uncharacterized membrane protein